VRGEQMANDAQFSSSEPESRHDGSTVWLLGFVLVGAAVSLALGAYSRGHVPTGRPISTFGFSTMLDMKVWLASAALVLAIVQLGTALRIYGRVGRGPCPPAIAITHRVSGVVAVTLTLPVAFHCMWSLGFGSYNARVLVHSLMGCLFYGVFVTKMLTVKSSRVPGWALPVLGGALFTSLVIIWSTSSLWFFTHGSPSY